MADDRTPKVTPHLMERALDLCPRRLAHEYECRDADTNPFARWRIRSPFVVAATLAHRPGRPRPMPSEADFVPPPELVHEEVALWERAAATYLAHFGAVDATSVDHGCDHATRSARFGVRVGGAVDVLVELDDDDVRFELRQFELWGRPLRADPLHNWEIALAVLRLARLLSGQRLRIRHVDLLGAEVDVGTVDYEADLVPLREAFGRRLAELRVRAAGGAAVPGAGCGQCHHVAGCPAHASDPPPTQEVA
jgi:hypothetical protein